MRRRIAGLEGRHRPAKKSESGARTYLLLKNAGVSTAGDSEQFVEINGKRYSHIIDPKTGIGLIGRRSVTVIAPNATISDGLIPASAFSASSAG